VRPIDLAREHGLSPQAIRNYDDAGVLPPTDRANSGHRRYTPLHAQALRAFLALRLGHGHQPAVEIMRAIHRRDLDSAYRLIDAAHLSLSAERTTLAEVASALSALTTATSPDTPSTSAQPDSTPTLTDPNPADASPAFSGTISGPTPGAFPGPPLTVGELARRLGVHPATLRTWESAGILRPARDRPTGYRVYSRDCVRDAEIARQLRRGGFPLRNVAQFIESLRTAGGPEALRSFLDAWRQRLMTRSRHLLAGAAQLDTYLTLVDQP
jgi:DNA-binding transcriptional MerR regulator